MTLRKHSPQVKKNEIKLSIRTVITSYNKMKSIWFICMMICLQTSVFHILAKQRLSSKQHFFFKYEGKITISYATSLQMKCIHGQQKRHSRNIFLEHGNSRKIVFKFKSKYRITLNLKLYAKRKQRKA